MTIDKWKEHIAILDKKNKENFVECERRKSLSKEELDVVYKKEKYLYEKNKINESEINEKTVIKLKYILFLIMLIASLLINGMTPIISIAIIFDVVNDIGKYKKKKG